MKHTIIFAVSLIVFSSCSKGYQCRCMNTKNNKFEGGHSITKDRAESEERCDWENNGSSAHAANPDITCTVEKIK